MKNLQLPQKIMLLGSGELGKEKRTFTGPSLGLKATRASTLHTSTSSLGSKGKSSIVAL